MCYGSTYFSNNVLYYAALHAYLYESPQALIRIDCTQFSDEVDYVTDSSIVFGCRKYPQLNIYESCLKRFGHRHQFLGMLAPHACCYILHFLATRKVQHSCSLEARQDIAAGMAAVVHLLPGATSQSNTSTVAAHGSGQRRANSG